MCFDLDPFSDARRFEKFLILHHLCVVTIKKHHIRRSRMS